jgi:hypothetical protein
MNDDQMRAEPIPARGAGPAVLPHGEGRGDLLGRLTEARALVGRERAEAPSLVAELLTRPRALQVAALAEDRRLHTWGVCELLLRCSQDCVEHDPAEAGRLAALSLATSERLSGRHPEPVLQDLRARAWAGVGEARRREGALTGAEDALRAAATCLAHGTGDLLVEAQLLEFEAVVRLDQGRRGEAAALLQQAASRYLAVNEPAPLDRVLLLRTRIRCDEERAHFTRPLLLEPSVG